MAEIQTGLQIQIDKDNSVSDLCLISIVLFGLTTHSLKSSWSQSWQEMQLTRGYVSESIVYRFCTVLGWAASFLDCSWWVPSKGFIGQGLTLALVLFPLASSDCYIYDSATGYYYDPLAGTYYDPNTQVSFWLCYFVSDSFEKSTCDLLLWRFYSLYSLVAHYMKSIKVYIYISWIFLHSRQLLHCCTMCTSCLLLVLKSPGFILSYIYLGGF